jgi:hypothetical protein
MSLRSYTVSVLDSQHKGAKWSTHRERERENRKSTSIYTEYTHTRRPGTSKQDLTANGSIPYIANSLMVHRYVFGGEEAHRIPSLHACDAIHAADTETCIASPRLAWPPLQGHRTCYPLHNFFWSLRTTGEEKSQPLCPVFCVLVHSAARKRVVN